MGADKRNIKSYKNLRYKSVGILKISYTFTIFNINEHRTTVIKLHFQFFRLIKTDIAWSRTYGEADIKVIDEKYVKLTEE